MTFLSFALINFHKLVKRNNPVRSKNPSFTFSRTLNLVGNEQAYYAKCLARYIPKILCFELNKLPVALEEFFAE